MTKNWLALAGLGLALLAVPYLACSSSNETEARYSEADLKRAVGGTWEGTAEIEGESVDFSLVLEPASGRSKPGAVSVPLTGTVTSVNPTLNGAVDGEVSAGVELDPAELSLRLEDGTQLAGALQKQALSDGRVTRPQQIGTFSLSRP